VKQLRSSLTEEELIYWAAYFEVKYEKEKIELNRQKANRR